MGDAIQETWDAWTLANARMWELRAIAARAAWPEIKAAQEAAEAAARESQAAETAWVIATQSAARI